MEGFRTGQIFHPSEEAKEDNVPLIHSLVDEGEKPGSPCIFLGIGGQAGAASLQVPVILRNLSSELVTLEVKSPWAKVNSGNLHGRTSSIQLRLMPQSSMSVMRLQINITSLMTNDDKGEG